MISLWWYRQWCLFLASFRLSMPQVCAMSVGRKANEDFHDYPDSTTPVPTMFYDHTCKRCGKTFTI